MPSSKRKSASAVPETPPPPSKRPRSDPPLSHVSSKKPMPKTYSKKGLSRSQPSHTADDTSSSNSPSFEIPTPKSKGPHRPKGASNKAPILVEWDEDDEGLLHNTSDVELRLWRRTWDLFGLIPPQLLPHGVDVTSSDSKSVSGGATYIAAGQEGAWTKTTCTSWLRLLCLPVFLENGSYFTYSLAQALSCRTDSHWPEKNIIRDKEGKLKDTRLKFVRHIIHAHNNANIAHSDPSIISRDFDIIERAWDGYADTRRKDGNRRSNSEILSVKAYHSQFTSGLGRPGTWKDKSRDFILGLKKKWLMSKANPDVVREPSPITPERMTLDLKENGMHSYARIPLIPKTSKQKRALPDSDVSDLDADSEHETSPKRRRTSVPTKRRKLTDSDAEFGAGSRTARRWSTEGKKLGKANEQEAKKLKSVADAKKARAVAEQAAEDEDELYPRQVVVSSLGIRIEIPSKRLDCTTIVAAAAPSVVGGQPFVQVPCTAPPGTAAIPEKLLSSTASMILDSQTENDIQSIDSEPFFPGSNSATSSPSITPSSDRGVGSGPTLREVASRTLSFRPDPETPNAHMAIYKPAALLGDEWDLTRFQTTNKFSVGRIPMTGFDSTAFLLLAAEEGELELSEDNWHNEAYIFGGNVEDEVVERWINGFPRAPYHEWKPT